MTTRRSAVWVLRMLPEVFDLRTFGRMMDSDQTSVRRRLASWTRAGLVRPAGPGAGIYFNLIVAPDAPTRLAAGALRMAYPSAVLHGVSVLHDAGWVTQIPQVATVAVLERTTYVAVDGFEVAGRARSWYVEVRAGLRVGVALPSLTPAMALADAYRHRDSWRPDADDLYLDDGDLEGIRNAFQVLGATLPSFLGGD